ncbi:hypothetical protein [Amycolatopsis sp. lyj-84]|uniref:hypothetical protein n=1 Tax=Amycolatopsis sp. lyj-84 TaxID=2789284 RepID=UPI00397E7F00
MARVIIAFHHDHTQVGKTVTVDDDQAVTMVAEGRARFADDSDEAVQINAVRKPAPKAIGEK